MPKPAPEASFERVVEELVRRSNEEIRRIRDLEQRIDGVEAKSATLEQLILERTRKLDQRALEIEQKIAVLSEEVFKLRSIIEKAVKQMDRLATKTEVRELENAFNLISVERHTKPVAAEEQSY